MARTLGCTGRYSGNTEGCLGCGKHVGNYSEVFERNVGSGSRLNIARGLNKLWYQGGLQYAPPIR